MKKINNYIITTKISWHFFFFPPISCSLGVGCRNLVTFAPNQLLKAHQTVFLFYYDWLINGMQRTLVCHWEFQETYMHQTLSEETSFLPTGSSSLNNLALLKVNTIHAWIMYALDQRRRRNKLTYTWTIHFRNKFRYPYCNLSWRWHKLLNFFQD